MENTPQRVNRVGWTARRMPQLWFALLLIIVTTAACQPVAAQAPASAAGSAARKPLPATVSIKEAAVQRDAGALMLDVRTPAEYQEYHMPGSTLIPLNDLERRLAELPRDRAIVVVCRSGNRSATARDLLLKAGYPQVTSMAGGLLEWRSAGQPVE